MPALFALGQHPALEEVQSHLIEGEMLFSFLDDIYIVCEPHRVSFIFERVQIALFRHAHIEVNLGKTRIWNSGGVEPPGARAMGTAEEPSWVGDRTLPAHRQGLVVLGAPVGSPEFIQTSLHEARREHDVFFE